MGDGELFHQAWGWAKPLWCFGLWWNWKVYICCEGSELFRESDSELLQFCSWVSIRLKTDDRPAHYSVYVQHAEVYRWQCSSADQSNTSDWTITTNKRWVNIVHSCSPADESNLLWWSPDFFCSATSSLISMALTDIFKQILSPGEISHWLWWSRDSSP